MVIKQFKFNMDGLMNWIVKMRNSKMKLLVIARKRKIDNRFVFKCFI